MIDKTDPTNRDTVPAMLTPGEFVLNKEASTMFAPVIEQMNAAGLQHRAMKNMGGGIPTYNKGGDVKPSLQQGIAEAAAALGVDPIDLATIISYETAGTLSPTQKGPTTKWGQHRGYIQFGEPQAKEYGVDFSSEDSAMSSQLGANGAIVKYFKAHGFKPGMGLMDLYSIVNAGGPGRYNWSDEKAGGAKGTVSDKVIKQMPAHRDKAIKLLGVNFAPETSVRPQSRGDVPPQATPQLIAQADPLSVEQAIMQSSVPQVQAAPPVPTGFGEAFKDARADMGAGGIFTFRGRDYTTNYSEEEDKTMTANMGGVVYLNNGDPVTNPSSGFGSSLEYNYDTYLKEMGYNDVPAVREMWGRYQDKMNAESAEVPMPEVNSDESLLQGSSGSVERAARSFPSDYPINMDVPRVEGYNIPVPIQAPRPTMINGQLYYLNADGLVTDSNGNPVQDPEIGAAVQDKLNYSAEESAANAQAYNESIAQQNVFNGINPQSVNPSYDSMRQQQESNAAEAERIRKEIAETDAKREALRVEFNNRNPPVVPELEGGPTLDVPAYEGELGLGIPSLVTTPPTAVKIPLMKDDIVQAQQVLNPYDFNPYGDDPMGEIPKVENSDGYTNEELRVLANTDNAEGSPWAGILQERTERQASELRSKLQKDADNGIVPTQSSLNQLSDLERQSRNANEVKAVNDKVVAANQQSVATTKDALGATERERKLRAIERAAEYGITVNDNPSGSSEKVTSKKVAGIIDNLPEGANTSPDQDRKAKEAAAAEEARLKQSGNGDVKKTPEVSGAMSMLKSVFGDLFDSKELIRAAIMYLGGRATGMDGNQALAFAGKNYIARVDAKEGTYQKVALEGKHTKDSLAVYKKTLNPADLVAKDQPAIETGEYKEMYHTKSGTPVMLIEKETSTGRKLYFYEGKQVNLNDFTTDGRYSVGSKDHGVYVGQLESDVISQVKELHEINMTDSDSNGKGSKPIIGITPTGIATQAANYVIKNQLPREVMRDLVSIAYQDAMAEKISTGKTPSSLEPFFERAYVKSRTSNVVNFTLGNGKPAPAASVNQFFTTIRDMATAAEQVENPDFKLSNLNDTQLSTWLLQSKTYTSWNQITDPEEKKYFVDRGAKEVPPRSGFMQYVLEGYPKTS